MGTHLQVGFHALCQGQEACHISGRKSQQLGFQWPPHPHLSIRIHALVHSCVQPSRIGKYICRNAKDLEGYEEIES